MSGPRLVWERPRTRAALLQPTPVQTPAAPPLHPDQRVANAVHAAWWSGHDTAEKNQYAKGWRAGLRIGLLWGVLLGAAGVLAGLAAPAAATTAARWAATWWGV